MTKNWIAVSQYRLTLGLGGFVFLIFLWAIRRDLRYSWQRQTAIPSPTTFNPLEIAAPYDVYKDRVRKLSLSNRHFIPFRLSDTPPKGWTRMFRKNWKKRTGKQGSVFFKESELRLISKLSDVERIFLGLKETIDLANSDYLKFLKQAETKEREAEEKAKVRKEEEVCKKQIISTTLGKLN